MWVKQTSVHVTLKNVTWNLELLEVDIHWKSTGLQQKLIVFVQ